MVQVSRRTLLLGSTAAGVCDEPRRLRTAAAGRRKRWYGGRPGQRSAA